MVFLRTVFFHADPLWCTCPAGLRGFLQTPSVLPTAASTYRDEDCEQLQDPRTSAVPQKWCYDNRLIASFHGLCRPSICRHLYFLLVILVLARLANLVQTGNGGRRSDNSGLAKLRLQQTQDLT